MVGDPNDEPAALILIAVTMVTANVGLFIAMRRAKRKEQEEKTDDYSVTELTWRENDSSADEYQSNANEASRTNLWTVFTATSCGSATS